MSDWTPAETGMEEDEPEIICPATIALAITATTMVALRKLAFGTRMICNG